MPTSTTAKQRTLAQCVDLLRLKHYALTTERSYLGHISSYIDWLIQHGSALPDSRSRVQTYLTSMAHRGCSASSQNQAFNALLFLYTQVRHETLPDIHALRAKPTQHRRQALTREQTHALLAGIQDHAGHPIRLITQLLYGCGLRVSEPLNLRIKDIDPTAWRLTLRGCKGGKDRTVIVPHSLRPALANQIEHARAIWKRDRQTQLPVEVPGLLARKYPNAPHAWQWFWLFPAHTPCIHPRTGQTVRWRIHEANIQRAVKNSAQKLQLQGLATPHILRHCCATHILEAGGNIRDVQDLLGHSHINTTMIYVHGDSERIHSPLETLPILPVNIIPFTPQPYQPQPHAQTLTIRSA